MSSVLGWIPNTKIFTPIDLIVPLLEAYPTKKKIREANTDLCTDIFITVLFIILSDKKTSLIAEKDLGIS